MQTGLSPLELLHPDGVARHATVIGAGCPDRLRPRRPEPRADELADLVVIAPTQGELAEAGWLEAAAERAGAELAEDGVVYVLAPGRARARIAGFLTRNGVVPRASFAHDPNSDGVRTIVPLSPGTAHYAFTNLVATRPGRRRAVLFALRSEWIARLVTRVLPEGGLSAGRAGGRPFFEWLFALRGENVPAPAGIVSVSWRETSGASVVHGFADTASTPAIVAKVRAPSDNGISREADLIRQLGPAARAAGAAVPEPLLVDVSTERALMFQEPVEGRSAAAVLGDSPGLLSSVVHRLVEWLENWNLDTRTYTQLSGDRLDDELRHPARALADLLDDGARYVEWVDGRCSALEGTTVPLVASHNDLTMLNVFIADSGAIGIVDWEDAREEDLPLVDFYYAVVDAAAAAARYADRAAAFRSLYGNGGGASTIPSVESRLVRALNLTPELAEVSFHACWLRSAVREQRLATGGRRPFLEIVRLAASAVG